MIYFMIFDNINSDQIGEQYLKETEKFHDHKQFINYDWVINLNIYQQR